MKEREASLSLSLSLSLFHVVHFFREFPCGDLAGYIAAAAAEGYGWNEVEEKIDVKSEEEGSLILFFYLYTIDCH